jgi:hypothetical protein
MRPDGLPELADEGVFCACVYARPQQERAEGQECPVIYYPSQKIPLFCHVPDIIECFFYGCEQSDGGPYNKDDADYGDRAFVYFGEVTGDYAVEVFSDSYFALWFCRVGIFDCRQLKLVVDEVFDLLADFLIGGEQLEYHQYDDCEGDDTEKGVVGKCGGLLACAVFSQKCGAVGPEFDLKDN